MRPDGRRAGPALPGHWPVANPGLVRSEGHILMSEYPGLLAGGSALPGTNASITVDIHWHPDWQGQWVLKEYIWLLSWLKPKVPHGTLLLFNLFNPPTDGQVFPEI